ncbi:MAG TPA: FAD-dependent oxidoreductase, partial [Flavisolibacter sp.]|nr:FAD-dependent oxidoreductase [Flavisolibacter sp.]
MRHHFFALCPKEKMKRDGATISLWQDTTPEPFTGSREPGSVTYDVLIAGGGITGVTTALMLQKRGKKCIIAEAHTLCFGTTGGTTSHINTFLDTGYHIIREKFGTEATQLVAKATNASRDLFQQLVHEYNIDCGFEEKDGFLYAVDDQQAKQLDEIYKASKEAGVEVDYATSIPVPVPFTKAIVYRRQAQVHPSRYVTALAKAFEQAGGVILENCFVEQVKKSDADLRVNTTKGEIR